MMHEYSAGSDEAKSGLTDRRPRIVAAICTYRRNEPLRRLIEALLVCAERCRTRARVGLVVVDDSQERMAETIVGAYRTRFEGGCHYAVSGLQNISIARNLALTTALPSADWLVMTDDDCEPDPEWLNAFLDVQAQTGASSVTGPMLRRFAPGSPTWLSAQPFGLLGVDDEADGAEVTTGSTNNSLISADWLRINAVRFDPAFGKIGGEDMVFYRTARAEGLRIHFSRKAVVFEDLPAERSTFTYQVRRFFWQGNSAFVTCVRTGKSRNRMFVHGLASLARAAVRPVTQMTRGRPPEFRYAGALLAEAAGKLSGYVGLKVRHH